MNPIKVNQTVIVPSPELWDLWNHSFTGLVVEIKTNAGEKIATVEDGDGDCFDVEVNRLLPE